LQGVSVRKPCGLTSVEFYVTTVIAGVSVRKPCGLTSVEFYVTSVIAGVSVRKPCGLTSVGFYVTSVIAGVFQILHPNYDTVSVYKFLYRITRVMVFNATINNISVILNIQDI
jgi:hypothetical protein